MAITEEISIGSRVVRAFGAKDLKEVAQILGENYSSLYNWTSQRRDFPTGVLIKIAKMTNTSIDWILTGENGPPAVSDKAGGFDKIIEEKIRAVVRDELENGLVLQEKMQGLLLAMQPNITGQDVFETENKEEKAA